MDLLNFNVFSVGNVPVGTGDKLSLAGETGDLSQEFSKMLHVLRQSKFSNSEEMKLASGVRIIADENGEGDDLQPLKNLIDFMDAVESQLDNGNSKTASALPLHEETNGVSDLLGFLKLLRYEVTGGENDDVSKTHNKSSLKPNQFKEKDGATDLIEFEQVLNDLSGLIFTNGSIENTSSTSAIKRTDPTIEQTLGSLTKDESIVSTLGINRLESFSSHNSNETVVNLRDDALQIESKEANKSNNVLSAPETFLSTKAIEHERAEEQAFKAVKSSAKPVFMTSLPLQGSSVTNEGLLYEVAVRKLLQDVTVNGKPNLEQALSQLRELVEKLKAQRPDQPMSLTRNEQSKLVEAAKILRSINFEDLVPLFNLETSEDKDFGSETHGASVEAVTHIMDLKTLETLARSIFVENEDQTLQPAIKMTRTDFVAFPPEVTEKKAAFDVVLKVFPSDVDQLGASVHYSETDAKNIPVSMSIAEQTHEDENIITQGEYTDRVRLLMGDATSIQGRTSENSEELQTAKQTLHSGTIIPSPSIPGGAEKPAVTMQTLHADKTLPSPSVSGGVQKLSSTVTPIKKDVASTNNVASRNSIFHDVDPSKATKTTQSEITEIAPEYEGLSQTLQASSHSKNIDVDHSISKAKLVVQQLDEKLQSVSLNSNEQPGPTNSAQSYERPLIQSDKEILGNTELMQVTRQAKGKDTGVQNSDNSILPKGELVEGKSKTVGKPQTDAQTANLELAPAKTSLRGGKSMLSSEQVKVKNTVDDLIPVVNEAITKKIVSEQKTHGVEIGKHSFELPQPKLKQTPLNRDFPSKLQATTDFSARAADALMLQAQSHIRKKSTGSVGAVTVAPINLESSMLLQTSSDLANHNVGAQKHVGSERLEKWIDTQLDLTSRGWVNNLAKTMVSAINRGQQRLMLALSPPSLGRINIVFNAKSTGLDLRIHAERKATLSLLGDAEIKLVSNLENAGHKVNNLSYAEMSATANDFGFNYNQSSNNDKDGAHQGDVPEQEKVSDNAQGEHDKAVAKNIDDASLVNITV